MALRKRVSTLKLVSPFIKELRGKDGVAGVAGSPGVAGPKGDTGATGATGPAGPQGLQGSAGVAGLTGAPGLNGINGIDGATGDMGPMPKHQLKGDAIRFELALGVWGKWINLSSQSGGYFPGGGISEDRVIQLIAELGAVSVDDNTLIDTVGSLKYIGYSTPGTAESAALWKIKRIDLTDATGDIPILFADGSANYDKVWDDRLSFSYTPTGL